MRKISALNSVLINKRNSVFRKLITVFAISLSFVSISCSVKAQSLIEPAQTKSQAIQTNAEFPGGVDKFYAYILAKVNPDSTCSPGKRIYVQFMVDREGFVRHARVRGNDLSKKMNSQLVKVFEAAPKWTPAQQNGTQVREHFVCPVMFTPKPDLMAANTNK